MADRLREIMNLVRNVSEEENLRVTIKGAARNGICAGVGGAVGCILGGPLGGVPGAAIGAGLAAAIGAGLAAAIGKDFKPLFQVIAECPDETKRQLANNIENIMRRVDGQDVVVLAEMVAGGAAALRAEIVAAIIGYCQNEMRLQIADH